MTSHQNFFDIKDPRNVPLNRVPRTALERKYPLVSYERKNGVPTTPHVERKYSFSRRDERQETLWSRTRKNKQLKLSLKTVAYILALYGVLFIMVTFYSGIGAIEVVGHPDHITEEARRIELEVIEKEKNYEESRLSIEVVINETEKDRTDFESAPTTYTRELKAKEMKDNEDAMLNLSLSLNSTYLSLKKGYISLIELCRWKDHSSCVEVVKLEGERQVSDLILKLRKEMQLSPLISKISECTSICHVEQVRVDLEEIFPRIIEVYDAFSNGRIVTGITSLVAVVAPGVAKLLKYDFNYMKMVSSILIPALPLIATSFWTQNSGSDNEFGGWIMPKWLEMLVPGDWFLATATRLSRMLASKH